MKKRKGDLRQLKTGKDEGIFPIKFLMLVLYKKKKITREFSKIKD